MQTLQQEQYDLVVNYTDIIGTIKQGLDYIEDKYEAADYKEADWMIGEVLSGLEQLSNAHEVLASVLSDDPTVQKELNRFRDFNTMLGNVENVLEQPDEKERLIREQFVPTVVTWYQSMNQALAPYIQQ